MSMTPPEMSPEATQPPRKTGMSGRAKLLIALGVGGGILVLVCCGGLIGIGIIVAGGMSQDPEVVREKTKEITEIEIPDGLEPKMSFDVKFPIYGRVMLWVAYLDEETDSGFVMLVLRDESARPSQAEMEKVTGDMLRQQQLEEPEQITVEQSDTEEVEIRGEAFTFTIEKGTGLESNTPRIQVKGVFQGKTGPAFLKFSGDAEKFSEEQIKEMIESIE